MELQKELRLEVGKYYKNRDGRRVYVSGMNPFSGDGIDIYLVVDEYGAVRNYFPSGRYMSGLGSSPDIIEEWKEDAAIERYITLCAGYNDANQVVLWRHSPNLGKLGSYSVIKVRIDPGAPPGKRIVEIAE